MGDDDAAGSPLDGVLGFQLRRAHMQFAKLWQPSFNDRQGRVTPMQGGMLIGIESRPGMTQAALARLMDVEGPTLLQALDKLVQAGLVERARHADDRRSSALHLTAPGRQAVAIVKDYLPHRDAALLQDLSGAERAQLLDLLQRIVRRSRAMAAPIHRSADCFEAAGLKEPAP